MVAVAAEVDGKPLGIAASSFTSVSLDAGAGVVLRGQHLRDLAAAARGAGHLGLSVLADHHDAVCRQLAGPAEHRFDGLAVTRDRGRRAAARRGRGSTFDCTIEQEIEAGDHTIVLLALHAVDDDGGSPLVFHRSGFGRLEDSA